MQLAEVRYQKHHWSYWYILRTNGRQTDPRRVSSVSSRNWYNQILSIPRNIESNRKINSKSGGYVQTTVTCSARKMPLSGRVHNRRHSISLKNRCIQPHANTVHRKCSSDASSYCFRVVLLHCKDDMKIHCISLIMSETETHYAQIEKRPWQWNRHVNASCGFRLCNRNWP